MRVDSLKGSGVGYAEPDDEDVRIGSRDSERVRVWAPIQAVDCDGVVTIIIRDLGTTGARVEARPPRFRSGDVVLLQLPLLAAEKVGEIVWSNGAMAGIEFSQPLDRPTFQILVRTMQSPPDTLKGWQGVSFRRGYRIQS